MNNKYFFFISFLILTHITRLCAQDIKAISQSYIDKNGVQIIEKFRELLLIPNVAYDLPNINKNADFIKKELEKRDVQTKLLRIIGTPPIIYGYLPTKGAKHTIAFYVHYDGQPVDKSKWNNDPWKPTYYSKADFLGGKPLDFPKSSESIDIENRIYARSAGDDKAPIIALLFALDLIKENKLKISSNIVFFFEGQEEAGSKQLRTYLQNNQKLVEEIDLWLFCDGPIHQSGKPQLVFGVRGVTGMEVTVYGPNRPLHSGHYGNWSPVPGQLLASLLHSMKDEDGNVLIEGYYDDVTPLTTLEKNALEKIPPIDSQLKEELSVYRPEGEGSYYERLLLPSLTIRGLSSGNVGKLSRNIIPSSATASLGMRLVKGCDPEKQKDLIEAHIEKQGFHIVREAPSHEIKLKHRKIAWVKRKSGYPAAKTRMDDALAKKVIDRAKLIAGDDLILLPTLGGSLPLYLFTDVLNKPALIVPIANHDNNQHAANENLKIKNLWYGIQLMTALLTIK